METAALIRRVWQVLEPDLETLGYELVEVEFARQGGAALLRVFIDKEGGGITLEDCTCAARVLDPLLDAVDFIDERYLLEVSSPGWNRPLRKPEHFARHVGATVRIVTHAPLEGRTRFKGELTGMDTDLVRLDVAGQTLGFHLDNIKKARLER